MALLRGQPKPTAAGTPSVGGGPLASLEGGQLQLQQYSYPIDINNLGHCMLFQVAAQTTNSGGQPSAAGNSGLQVLQGANQTRTQAAVSGTPAGSTAISSGAGTILNQANQSFGTQFSQVNPFATLTTTAIALYVPETVVFSDKQTYVTPNMTEVVPRIAGEIGGTLLGVAGRFGAVGAIGSGLLGGLAAAAGSETLKYASLLGLGYAVNPIIEVFYSNPELRTFHFDFVFAPRSSSEADNVFNIIYTFRRNMVPQYANLSGAFKGALFIPPSQFEITFLQNQSGNFIENSNIPRISTCVLTDLSTNWAPDNEWSTTVDGMPVHTTLSLDFQELNILTVTDIDNGY